MRLICPNCGAQYEVPDDVIPDGGRDVQCSNCGHTWFERPGASVAAEEGISAIDMAEPDLDAEPQETVAPPAPVDEPEEWQGFGELPTARPAPRRPAAPRAAPTEPQDDDAGDEPAPQPARRGSALDPEVAEILRAEAAREEAARRADAPAPAPEPAVDRQHREESQRRLARMRGNEQEKPADDARAAGRRDRLPDVEEINSTLRSTEDRAPAPDAPSEGRRPASYRRGFALAVLIVTALTALYVMAPDLSLRFPGAKPALDVYGDLIDSLRLALDAGMQALIDLIGGAPTSGTT